MLRKALGQLQPGSLVIKAEGDQGIVRAVFATMNQIDHDGDVTRPGAFGQQNVRMAQWGHNWGALPIGRGQIHEEGDKAIFDGEFFLDTTHGRDAFNTVKGLGDLQEWSYGFDITRASFGKFNDRDVRFIEQSKVHEVSPVMLGAGIDTGTENIKGLASKGGIRPHSTETADGSWDGPAQQAHLSNDDGAAVYRTAYAWVDPEADPDTKSAYRFIHHFVSADGKVGPASTVAAAMGIGVLNGGRGGTTIPDADREAVYAHLAKHLTDAGREPPELSSKALGLSFTDHYETALSQLAGAGVFLERAKALVAMRGKEGRTFSAANIERLQAVAEHHRQSLSLIEELLDLVRTAPADDPAKARDALSNLWAQYLQIVQPSI